MTPAQRHGLVRHMLRKGGIEVWITFALTFAAGLVQALGIAWIGFGAEDIRHGSIAWRDAATFLVLFKLMLLLGGMAQIRGRRFAERLVNDAMFRLALHLPEGDLDRLERQGGRSLMDEAMQRAEALGTGAHAAFGMIYCAGQVIGAIGAIGVVAPVVVVLVVAAGAVCFHIDQRMRATEDRLARAADGAEAGFTRLAREFVDGFRELQAGRSKSADFVENHLLPAARRASDARRPLSRAGSLTLGMAALSWLMMSFVAAFVAPALGFTTGIALAVFGASLGFDAFFGIVTYVPILPPGQQAADWFEHTATTLAPGFRASESASAPTSPHMRNFASIELRGVTYAYEGAAYEGAAYEGAAYEGADRDRPDGQTIGPIDLSLRRGEIVLVTGGNGSGKSTLLKLLCGLYTPQRGEIRIDRVHWHVDDQRGLFSAVFTEFHLFDLRLNERRASDPDGQEWIVAMLKTLGLTGNILVGEVARANPTLSTGQRKRLALIQALIEDRPVLLLDEWTADQDPEFRAWFFDNLLPELKRQGRTIVAVTHDDRYFDRGDRLLRMVDGRLLVDVPQAADA
jgi:putative ATP-binding cassette transporter